MDGPDSIDQAYDDAWDAFVNGGKIQSASGIRSTEDILHLVFLLPVGQIPDIGARIAPIQQRLAFTYADLVPAERLRVSIQGFDVKPSDWDARREEVLAPARAVFSRHRPFTLRLGWLNSFPMAAFLRAKDAGIIRQWRAGLRSALPDWVGLSRDPLVHDDQDMWLPHLSLAYYNKEQVNRDLVEAIAPLRAKAVADIQVQEVHLVSTPSALAGANPWGWPLHAQFELVGAR